MFLLFHFIIVVILGFVELVGVRVDELVLLYILGTFLPYLAVSVRRLHDTNRSGWWVFIAVVPFVGPFVLLWFMATAGNPSENKYGPNPKAARRRPPVEYC